MCGVQAKGALSSAGCDRAGTALAGLSGWVARKEGCATRTAGRTAAHIGETVQLVEVGPQDRQSSMRDRVRELNRTDYNAYSLMVFVVGLRGRIGVRRGQHSEQCCVCVCLAACVTRAKESS